MGRLTHAAVPAFGIGVSPDDAGVALLEVLLAWWLDDHVDLWAKALCTDAIGLGGLGRPWSGWGVHVVLMVLLLEQ